MIAPHARVFVVEALSWRLVEVERLLDPAVTNEPSAPSADPEDALRELMVQHLPRAGSMDVDRRARVCGLLCGLAPEALGSDVRFLDAFNTWFERVDASWRSDRGWQQVLQVYAGALRRAIAEQR